MKILECSSRGDKRFSSFYAKVSLYNKFESIEQFYQLSKRFIENEETGKVVIPKDLKEGKGKKIEWFVVRGKIFEPKYLTSFFMLLWVKYLDENPSLVEYAKQFNTFNDMFRGKSINCQADAVRKYVKDGRKSVLKENIEFIRLIKLMPMIEVIDGDLLESKCDIYGHQVNCLGIMGGGIALSVKSRYSYIFEKYKKYCEEKGKSQVMLGDCQITPDVISGKIIANLFGQYDIGVDSVKTNNSALKKSLTTLKKYAILNSLSIGIPFNIGCGLAGGDWNEVYQIIEEVFVDYPVYLCKFSK